MAPAGCASHRDLPQLSTFIDFDDAHVSSDAAMADLDLTYLGQLVPVRRLLGAWHEK